MYLILEVFDHWDWDSATISELELYNSNNNKINYNVVSVYDFVTKGTPFYWNGSVWGYENLYDESHYYVSNSTGNDSSTLFMWDSDHTSKAGDRDWARFAIELNEKDLSKIKMWVGSPEGRIPKEISVFATETLNNKNINQRNNEGLKFIDKLSFSSSLTSPELFEINVQLEDKTFLFKDHNTLKTFDLINKKWVTTKKTYNGISSLNNLIQNTSKSFNTANKKILPSGNTFNKPVNLKSFKTIENIKVV